MEAVKGQFGFLSYEQDEGKKLSFHVSEVEGGEFSAGDRDLKGFVQKMAVTAGASTAIVEAKRQEDVAAKPGFLKGFVQRKVVKQTVIMMVYGGTKYSDCSHQIGCSLFACC